MEFQNLPHLFSCPFLRKPVSHVGFLPSTLIIIACFISLLIFAGPGKECMSPVVMAIPGSQLEYIWTELQSRIRGLTCDPDLEAGRQNFPIWILAMKSLVPGKVVHTFNPRRLRQGGRPVQGEPWIKQVPDPGMVVHTFNLGHTFCWRPT